MKGLITPLITTHEPPSMGAMGVTSLVRNLHSIRDLIVSWYIKGRYGGFRKLGVPYFGALIIKDPTT